MSKPQLIIAGPGAGKTHGLVNHIIHNLKYLASSRYMVVITYTNSAKNNIKNRLSKRIQIPPNLFIGTMHSFLNKFIVIPYSSLNNAHIKIEKLFIQCATNDIFNKHVKDNGERFDPQQASIIKKNIKSNMQRRGYITYDQTIAIAKQCFENKDSRIKKTIANRIQYLFVDEFQDTSNNIFYIIDTIRKEKKTNIYCVGDPEQYIQSYDSSIKKFTNIPILKVAGSSTYTVEINNSNYRCSQPIIDFLNKFNRRVIKGNKFNQVCKKEPSQEPVFFINKFENISNIIPLFQAQCERLSITANDRCILAKRNDVVRRVTAALGGNVISPRKELNISPINEIKDALLSSLGLNQTEYLNKYNCSKFELIKKCIQILKAIKNSKITNENTFFKFINEDLDLEVKAAIPFKIENFRINSVKVSKENSTVVSNIHNYKGLQSLAILVIAKTEEELLLWIEQNQENRDSVRTKETTDYPRLGYVAFSRAQKLRVTFILWGLSKKFM